MKRAVGVVVVLAAVVAFFVWRSRETATGDAGKLTLHGNVELREAQLAFESDQRVVELCVEEGDRVQAGQLLGRLRDVTLEAQLADARGQAQAQEQALLRLQNGSRPEEIAQAEAALGAAQARLRQAQRDLERASATAGAGVSTQQSLDAAQAQLDVSRADVHEREQALALARIGPRAEDLAQAAALLAARRAEVQLLETQLADTKLYAPQAGVIHSRLLEVGELASPGRPAFTLALSDPKWARVYVSEPDLGRIRPGQPAAAVSDSHPDQPVSGWVGFVSPVAEFTPKNVETAELRSQLVYEVRVYLHDPEDRLRLGQPVTVTVDLEAPLVPDHVSDPASVDSTTAPGQQ